MVQSPSIIHTHIIVGEGLSSGGVRGGRGWGEEHVCWNSFTSSYTHILNQCVKLNVYLHHRGLQNDESFIIPYPSTGVAYNRICIINQTICVQVHKTFMLSMLSVQIVPTHGEL